MNIASSRDHVAARVERYVTSVPSLSGATLRETLVDLFGARTRTVILGGLVRDLARGGIASRHFDVDVVLDLDANEVADIGRMEHATANVFGGYGTARDGWKIDFWALSNTWAHKAGHAHINSSADVLDTTFFNVDAVAYDLKSHSALMYDNYLDDLNSKVLEIKLEPNPSIAGNVVRAIRRLRMWRFRAGPRLASFLTEHVDREMLSHVVKTELRLYGKSYAAEYNNPEELFDDLVTYSLKKEEQLELCL